MEPVLGIAVGIAIFLAMGIAGRTIFTSIKEARLSRLSRKKESDSRRPILYLRSFRDDGTATGLPIGLFASPYSIFLLGLKPYTFECQLAFELRRVGPIVYIEEDIALTWDSPQADYWPDDGGAGLPEIQRCMKRISARGSTWQSKVAALMQDCILTVLRVGFTDGLTWELTEAVKRVPPNALIIYVQPGREDYRSVREARYRSWRETVGEKFPKGLPEQIHGALLLHFDAEWNPRTSMSMRQVLKEKRLLRRQ